MLVPDQKKPTQADDAPGSHKYPAIDVQRSPAIRPQINLSSCLLVRLLPFVRVPLPQGQP